MSDFFGHFFVGWVFAKMQGLYLATFSRRKKIKDFQKFNHYNKAKTDPMEILGSVLFYRCQIKDLTRWFSPFSYSASYSVTSINVRNHFPSILVMTKRNPLIGALSLLFSASVTKTTFLGLELILKIL